MKIKAVLAAAALSITATMGHSALLDASDTGGTFDLLSDEFQFQDIFDDTFTSPLTFTFVNSSATDAIVTISSATINQLGSAAFFVGGATVAWDANGVVASAAQGETAGGFIEFVLAAGTDDTLVLDFGTPSASGSLLPDIDFLVSAELAPIPVPAGILLMGTALAGFGVIRRKARKAA